MVERHSNWVRVVAFSHNSTRFTMVFESTVKIRDVSSDECLYMFEGYSCLFCLVVFSYDLAWLTWALYDFTVRSGMRVVANTQY
jgi:WD40 repeat protein